MNPSTCILWMLSASVGVSDSSPWLGMGEPQNQAGLFEVTLDAPASALRRVEKIVERNRIVLFVPGVQASTRSLLIEQGPVRQLKVRPAAQGAAIALYTRGLAHPLAANLTIVTEPRGAIRLKSTMVEASGNSLAVQATNAKLGPVLANEWGMPAPAPTIAAAQAPTAGSEPSNQPSFVRPGTGAVPHAPSSLADGSQRNNQASGTGRLGTSPMLAASPTLAQPTTTTRLWTVFVALLVLAGAGAALFGRLRRGRAGGAVAAESIDVLATRSLGTKQKLILLNACGDRLLLAATDKEVRLLREFPGNGKAAPFSEALAGATTSLESTQPHADLRGLIALREQCGISPTENVAARLPDGVAA